MHGARERNSVRWEARRALLDLEIERLEREVAAASANPARLAALRQQLDEAVRRRGVLGPAPQPKMG
ncbi:MAG TPA: hypothetical protein VF818_12570 [Ktedonobacterales bacterium]|jgi:hypothetical protein